MKMNLGEFQDKLLAALPDIPAQAQRGGRYVLDHPDDVVIYSMREIAERAGVSPATLVRLVNLLGSAKWSEIRLIHSDICVRRRRLYRSGAGGGRQRGPGSGSGNLPLAQGKPVAYRGGQQRRRDP